MQTMRIAGCALAVSALLIACAEQAPVDVAGRATVAAPAFLHGSNPANSNGAVVFRGDIGCAVVDGNGNWFPQTFDLPCGTEVATFSANGNAKVTVQASGAPNPTGKTIHWGPYNPGPDWVASYPELTGPPYPCFLLGPDRDLDNPLFTLNWQATVTPSGQATLTCHYKKQWEFQWPD